MKLIFTKNNICLVIRLAYEQLLTFSKNNLLPNDDGVQVLIRNGNHTKKILFQIEPESNISPVVPEISTSV